MERVHRRTDIANTGGAQNRFIRMYLSDPSHSDPFLVLHSSILQPSSSLVALLAELLKLEPATTTPIYIYIYVRISRGGGGVGARVHIPGGRRAENNKVRLSSGTPLPPLHLPPSSIPLPPLSPAPLTLPSLEPSTLVYERPVPRSPFNLDPTYALQARRPYIHTYIHTYRRTYGGTSYLFYFIVSRSHPQA